MSVPAFMFKRILSILAIAGIFNLSLSFQLKQRFSGQEDAENVYHHAGQHFYYIWNFLDNPVENTIPVSQTTLVKYVPLQMAGITLQALAVLSFFAAASFTYVFFLPQIRSRQRIKLLPEHSNYLFRLKPF